MGNLMRFALTNAWGKKTKLNIGLVTVHVITITCLTCFSPGSYL